MNYRIIITEDHPLFCSALSNALSQAFEDVLIQEASNFDELQTKLADDASFDLILLDLQIPGAHGYSALLYLRSQYPEIPVVIISAREEPEIIQQAITHGASGFIPKSSPLDVLTEAVRQILEGEIWTPAYEVQPLQQDNEELRQLQQKISALTPQQYKVLGMLRSGLRNKQIAWELQVSEACIKAHVTAIFRKLGVNNRTQAVITLQMLEPFENETI